MSTFLYASRTAEEQASASRAPDTSSFLAALAAIVPAEVLALHALAVSLWVSTSQVVTPASPDGAQMTDVVSKVTNQSALQAAFWILIALSVVIFLGTKLSSGGLRPLDAVRAFIAPLAFVAWTMLQQGSAFDSVFHNVDEGLRTFIPAVAAVVLAYLAKWLGDKATESDPPGN